MTAMYRKIDVQINSFVHSIAVGTVVFAPRVNATDLEVLRLWYV